MLQLPQIAQTLNKKETAENSASSRLAFAQAAGKGDPHAPNWRLSNQSVI
jgi:hypothetical protein